MHLDCPECKKQKQDRLCLIDALYILKDVSVVPSLNASSDHCMSLARIHTTPADEKRILNVSSRLKMPTEINEKELLRQVEAADWSMAGGY